MAARGSARRARRCARLLQPCLQPCLQLCTSAPQQACSPSKPAAPHPARSAHRAPRTLRTPHLARSRLAAWPQLHCAGRKPTPTPKPKPKPKPAASPSLLLAACGRAPAASPSSWPSSAVSRPPWWAAPTTHGSASLEADAEAATPRRLPLRRRGATPSGGGRRGDPPLCFGAGRAHSMLAMFRFVAPPSSWRVCSRRASVLSETRPIRGSSLVGARHSCMPPPPPLPRDRMPCHQADVRAVRAPTRTSFVNYPHVTGRLCRCVVVSYACDMSLCVKSW